MKKYFLLVSFILLLFYGCGKKSAVKKSQKGVLISGWVFNIETGNPVANTKITITGENETISIKVPKGKYSFDITPGKYTIKVAKKGYIIQEEELDLTVKKNYEHDFIVKKGQKLTPQGKKAQEHLMAGVSAYNEGDLIKAKSELVTAYSLAPDNNMVKEYFAKVNEKISLLVDSLYKEALVKDAEGDKRKAANIYETILSYEPNHKVAKQRLNAINRALAVKPKPKPEPKPKPKPKPKPTVNVESIYKQGLSLFSQGKYKSAIAKFNTVLKYEPGHSGAKSYRAKAQKRLKALGG